MRTARKNVVEFPKSRVSRKHNQLVGWHRVWTDPDVVRFQECYATTKMSTRAIARISGVSETTLNNWLSGRTRRPLGITVRFAMAAMGWERPDWQKKT